MRMYDILSSHFVMKRPAIKLYYDLNVLSLKMFVINPLPLPVKTLST